MLSKADKYQQMIQDATRRIMLFPNADNKGKKSTVTFQNYLKLPSSYPFRSSQQIQKNIPINHHTSLQQKKQYLTSLQNEWPNSCIGLVLCEHNQNNQTYYVYGIGILIHKKMVFTSAQNVYCRRLDKEYKNIKFISGVNGNKCRGIYDVKIMHYPKEYSMQERYENYNFSVLQLYDDLSDSFGYIGLKIKGDIKKDEKYTEFGYLSGNQQGSFNLRQRAKYEKQQQDLEDCYGNRVLIKEIQNENNYYIVGLRNSEKIDVLSDKIRNTINSWTEFTQINIDNKEISLQTFMYLLQANFTHLTSISLRSNKIGTEGCKYLSQANWTNLTMIYLARNSINAQGCKYLTQANWKYLTTISLYENNIRAQGCKYLSQANWPHLTTISLDHNNIGAQGCKYLSKANWRHLTTISLSRNNISTQECKYLSQFNQTHLTTINLYGNKIDAQGCQYLSQGNWIHLATISLDKNKIDEQGCKYLSNTNWTSLRFMNLSMNNINDIIYPIVAQIVIPKRQNFYMIDNNKSINKINLDHIIIQLSTVYIINIKFNSSLKFQLFPFSIVLSLALASVDLPYLQITYP